MAAPSGPGSSNPPTAAGPTPPSPADSRSEQREIFKQSVVTLLENDDFNLTSPSLTITLVNIKSCALILFHSNNLESEELSMIWEKAAENAPGVTWAAVNLKSQKKIAKAFSSLTGDEPYFWAKLKQIPFILVYRQGFPVAFYNGARETQTLVDYALTLACSPDYREHLQVGRSTLSDDRLEMSSYQTYKFGEDRKVSGQYVADKSMRGFDAAVQMRQYSGSETAPGSTGPATAPGTASAAPSSTSPPTGTTGATKDPTTTSGPSAAEAVSGTPETLPAPMFQDQRGA